MKPWPPIGRDDLAEAASRSSFAHIFPILIRRLIHETAGGISKLEMPGESGTSVGGFDGEVICERGNAWVPAGESVWELSIANSANRKANSDFAKRLLQARPDVTYVQAILSVWQGAGTWAATKSRSAQWSEVRGLNLNSIAEWLETAPATTLWLAEQIGKPLTGVQDLEVWWESAWLRSTVPPLPGAVVLAGRGAGADRLRSLVTESTFVTLNVGGSDEAAAFVAATFADESSPRPILRVQNQESLEQLLRQPQPLTLLVHEKRLAQVASDGLGPHCVIYAAHVNRSDVDVERLDGSVVAGYFEDCGKPSRRAHELGVVARQSLGSLRRKLAEHPGLYEPSWAADPTLVARRLVMVGAWASNNQVDREILARFAGVSFDELIETAGQLASGSDPLFDTLDDRWNVVAFEESWQLIRSHLGTQDLEAFAAMAMDVLSTPLPFSEIAPEDRGRAGLLERAPRASKQLRKGIARTLAHLSVGAGQPDSVRAQSLCAGRIVRGVLRKANEHGTFEVWDSLADVMPLLAEAAPEAFVDAMWKGLGGDDPLLARMYVDGDSASGSLVGPPALQAPFLWALEVIAWNPRYLTDVVLVLGRMADIDPGGSWSKRPSASLSSILSTWRRGTSADVDLIRISLSQLLEKQGQVGWGVLKELLDRQQVLLPTQRPVANTWAESEDFTIQQSSELRAAAANLLLDQLGDDPQRFAEIQRLLMVLTTEERRQYIDQAAGLSVKTLDDQDRIAVYDALRDEIARHRDYADAPWALPESELVCLDEALDAFTSADPAIRHSWLFRDDFPDLGLGVASREYLARTEELERMRRTAVQEVWDHSAARGIVALARSVRLPYLVGYCMNRDVPRDELMIDWIGDEQDQSRVAVAAGYFRAKFLAEPHALQEVLAGCSEDVAAALLITHPDSVEASVVAESLSEGVASIYWQRFSTSGHGRSEIWKTAPTQLIKHGRPSAALDLLALYVDSDGFSTPKNTEVIATGFEELLRLGREDPDVGSLDEYRVDRLLEAMAQGHGQVNKQRLIAIEWQFAPLDSFYPEAPTIHATLSDDPDFFVHMVSRVYGRDHDIRNEDDSERATADPGRAWTLLRNFKRLPGRLSSGGVDEEVLSRWVVRARNKFNAIELSDVGDQEIGGLLARSSIDEVNRSIDPAVCGVVESTASGQLDKGLFIGALNRRGTSMRGLAEGGQQEAVLAEQYRAVADSVKAWPRVSKTMLQVADSYDADAHREDVEAESFRRGFRQ